MPRAKRRDAYTPKSFKARAVVNAEGCWVWPGVKSTNGYDKAGCQSKLAHRLSHELFKGPIPEGYQVDHGCKNRACVNPDHLEAVTPKVNNARSVSPSALNAMKLECTHGHSLAGANLYVTPDGRRQCKACRAEAVARSIAKSKEAPLA